MCVGGVSVEGLEDALEDYGGGDFAVGGFGDDEAAGGLDDGVGDNHVAADGEAVHEAGVACDGHLTVGDGP